MEQIVMEVNCFSLSLSTMWSCGESITSSFSALISELLEPSKTEAHSSKILISA